MDNSVTVVIVNWNSGDLLQRCLDALSRQTVVPEHVFVVDNASSDHSTECANRYHNVTLLSLPDNTGFASANNLAFDRCETTYVVTLNPDAFPEPHWLEALLTDAKEHPDVAAFGSLQVCDSDPEIVDGSGDVYHVSGLVWRADRGNLVGSVLGRERTIFSPCAAAAMYRRDALVEAGGFDTDFFCYVEDIDLGFRLRLAGETSLLVPTAVVRHVGSATSGGGHSDFAVYHGHRNLVWAYIKNMPSVLFWTLLPVHLLANVVSLAWFSLRGQGRVIFRAKLDAVRGIPRMWRKRTAIQSARTATVRSIWSVLDKRLNLLSRK